LITPTAFANYSQGNGLGSESQRPANSEGVRKTTVSGRGVGKRSLLTVQPRELFQSSPLIVSSSQGVALGWD
jgi:hypothetical protein